MNCSQLHVIGDCTVSRRLVMKHKEKDDSSMFHSITYDSISQSILMAQLPGSIPPLKFKPVPKPPANNVGECSKYTNPPLLPSQWSAHALLTPFTTNDLHTAKIAYSDDHNAVYTALTGPAGLLNEYLNVGDKTYVVRRNITHITCTGPYDYGWQTPARDWLSDKQCDCKGSLNISGVKTIAWSCTTNKLKDWYWFHDGNQSLWRVMFNNKSNPSQLPVFGEYTMIHFDDYGNNISELLQIYDICKDNSIYAILKDQTPLNHTSWISGFSYSGCSSSMIFPNWPEFFHMTATMIPVVLNDMNPLPTQVIYNWEIESQRTIMCQPYQVYNAYLIRNQTYLVNEAFNSSGTQCVSRLPFGPPKPNWMAMDNCTCMGTINNNYVLTPGNFTVIATCPVEGDRVFWTWFSLDQTVAFRPVIFFETLTPASEGTGLVLADYHEFYANSVLLDMQEFVVPLQCL